MRIFLPACSSSSVGYAMRASIKLDCHLNWLELALIVVILALKE
jgi:hypothetical protein